MFAAQDFCKYLTERSILVTSICKFSMSVIYFLKHNVRFKNKWTRTWRGRGQGGKGERVTGGAMT
jgi:hypothetical protein